MCRCACQYYQSLTDKYMCLYLYVCVCVTTVITIISHRLTGRAIDPVCESFSITFHVHWLVHEVPAAVFCIPINLIFIKWPFYFINFLGDNLSVVDKVCIRGVCASCVISVLS